MSAAGIVPLAAAWGSSFLFIRVAVPALGTFGVAEARAALGSAAVAVVLVIRSGRVRFTESLWRYVTLGAFASAAPYVLMSYATEQQGAALTAIFFATVPLFSVLVELAWFRLRPVPTVVVGLVVGLVGVTIVVRSESSDHGGQPLAGYAAALGAAVFSAIGGNYSRKHFTAEDPLTQTLGQSVTAAVLMLPAVAVAPPHHFPTMKEAGALLGLGIVCTAFAYSLLFRLVARLGATRALTAELLVPAFAALWSWLFIREKLPAEALVGAAVIVVGCALVMGWRPRLLRNRQEFR